MTKFGIAALATMSIVLGQYSAAEAQSYDYEGYASDYASDSSETEATALLYTEDYEYSPGREPAEPEDVCGSWCGGGQTGDNPGCRCPEPNDPPVSYELPIVVKTNTSGYTLPSGARHTTCTLYSNRVVIERGYGFDHTITETRKLDLEGDFWQLIRDAKREKVAKQQNYLCDGPSTYTTALHDIVLYSTGGCGNPRQVRSGGVGASVKLRAMINTYCPQTF